MTIELHVTGVKCNLSCAYCYQHPIRDAGNWAGKVDLEAMKASIVEEGGRFTVFGGEPLLAPKEILEELFAFGHKKFNKNAIQTNGVLIDEDHIRMFRKYRVGVGFSMDGPEELNDSRWAGSLEKTRAATAKSQANLEKLILEGTYLSNEKTAVPPSLIVTAYRGNALPEHWDRLKEWLKHLESLGMQHARIHPLEIDHPTVKEKMALTQEEASRFFIEMMIFERTLKTLKFDVFGDVRRLMRGDDRNVTCTWNACDPWTTEAVRGIDHQGNRSNCQRTNKEGIDFKKAEKGGWERQMGLSVVPYEQGGCGGCRFWSMCKGQCPGTGVGQDPRRRTEDCQMWMDLFKFVEGEMEDYGQIPLSKDPRRLELERILFQGWSVGKRLSIHTILQSMNQGKSRSEAVHKSDVTHEDAGHGDYTDHGDSDQHTDKHGDATQHVDDPAMGRLVREDKHGDGHGDQTTHGDSDGPDESHGDYTDVISPENAHGDYTDVGPRNKFEGHEATVTTGKQHSDATEEDHGDYTDHGDSDHQEQIGTEHGDHTDDGSPNHGDSY